MEPTDYQIKLPDSIDDFVNSMLFFRECAVYMRSNRLYGYFYLLANLAKLIPLRNFWVNHNLSELEKLITFVPFLTTIDTTLNNLFYSDDNQTQTPEFHELFKGQPLKYVPIQNVDGYVILEIVVNRANNSSNSVFGAKGMICPGNIVTSMLMKSLINFRSKYQIMVDHTKSKITLIN